MKVITSILTFIGLIYITRYVGKDEYGLIAWAMAFTATFSAISDLGFGTAHVKKLSGKLDTSDCITTYIFIKVLLTMAMALAILLSLVIWTIGFGNSIAEIDIKLILIFTLYQVLYSLSAIITTTYQAKMEVAKSQLILILDPLIRTPLIILLAIMGKGALDISYAYVIGAITVFCASIIIFSREKITLTKPRLLKEYFVFAFPVSFVSISTALTANLDVLFISAFGPISDVAYYSAGLTIMAMFSILGAAVSTVALPNFSYLVTRKLSKQIGSQLDMANKYILLIILPIVALFLIYPENIAQIVFGDGYGHSGMAIRYLIISTLFFLLYQSMSMCIIAMNMPGIYAKINIYSLLIKILLLALLVPVSLFGIGLAGLSFIGAAIASLISNFLLLILTYAVVRNKFGIRLSAQLINIIPMIAAVVALYLFHSVFPINNWYDIIIPSILTFIIFYLVSYSLKSLTKDDLRFFIDVVHPSKMSHYIISEIWKDSKN